MANIFGVHSVGNSIATFLRTTYPETLAGRTMPACEFELVSAGQLAGDVDEGTRITLWLYRISVSEHSRRQVGLHASEAGAGPLGLDLHFLMSAWGMTAEDEQVTLAWALHHLHQYPVLDASSLSPEAGWGNDEVIQIVPSQLSTEDLMRVWDALTASYRLSFSYVARVVRLDATSDETEHRPVVAARFAYGEEARR